jgi:hypothetical protein
MEEKTMDYEAGYVYDLMEKGGPTDVREPELSAPRLMPVCRMIRLT